MRTSVLVAATAGTVLTGLLGKSLSNPPSNTVEYRID